MTLPAAAALLGSYLLGACPTGFLFVKWRTGKDVRTVGSGNIGATNVTRAAGMSAGLIVFLFDVGKGLLASGVIAPMALRAYGPFGPAAAHPPTLVFRLACGLAAILGHNFPVFLRFKGGKGVATTIGVLLASDPFVAAGVLLVWGFCFLCWRYVSIGSLAAAAAIPLLQWLRHETNAARLLGAVIALLMIVRHHANIKRLLHGTEHRAGRR